MANRVQCSLIIDDDEIYNGFVKPLQRHHQLSELIVRLLVSYYKNDKVKTLVDSAEPSSIVSLSEAFRDIHETLAIMDYYAQEGENAVKDGKDTLAKLSGIASEIAPQLALADNSLFVTTSIMSDTDTLKRIVDEKQNVEENQSDLRDLTESIRDFKDSMIEAFQHGVVAAEQKPLAAAPSQSEFTQDNVDYIAEDVPVESGEVFEEIKGGDDESKDVEAVDAQQSLMSLLGSLE